MRADHFTAEQFDGIVTRYQEYAQRAYDSGFKVGPENHWGAEVVPANMKRLCEAVAHPGFGVLLHFRNNDGDAVMAPWAMHTHIAWDDHGAWAGNKHADAARGRLSGVLVGGTPQRAARIQRGRDPTGESR